MNEEKINELARAAEQLADDEIDHLERVHNRRYTLTESAGIYTRKLIELVVGECAELVEGFEITQEVALDEYVDYEASSVLKEHFGVKE